MPLILARYIGNSKHARETIDQASRERNGVFVEYETKDELVEDFRTEGSSPSLHCSFEHALSNLLDRQAVVVVDLESQLGHSVPVIRQIRDAEKSARIIVIGGASLMEISLARLNGVDEFIVRNDRCCDSLVIALNAIWDQQDRWTTSVRELYNMSQAMNKSPKNGKPSVDQPANSLKSA